MKKLVTVFQADDEGCWLASAAMLTGVGYDKLKGEFKFRNKVTGRSFQPLKALLKKHGVIVQQKAIKISEDCRLEDVKSDTLVYAKVHKCSHKKGASGHWMVWDHSEKVLRDPAGFAGDVLFELRSFRKVINRS